MHDCNLTLKTVEEEEEANWNRSAWKVLRMQKLGRCRQETADQSSELLVAVFPN